MAEVIDAALKGRPVARVDLTGGEPMAEPGIFDLIDRVRRYGAAPALVTDGSLIGPAEVRELKRRRVALVQLTILSLDRGVHARLKGADTLGETVHAAVLLGKAKVPFSVAFICTRLNHGDFEEVVRLSRALGAKSVAFSRLCTVGEALHHRDEIWPERWMVAECLERLPELARANRIQVYNAVAVPHCVSPGGGSCSVISGQPNYTVDVGFEVRPCSLSTMVLGDLRRDSWAVIEGRYAQLVERLRAEVPDACRGCAKLERCGGGCLESARSVGRGEPDPLAAPPGFE
jgi:radical SAM protein with 4Fe4S-binding SPASM domain